MSYHQLDAFERQYEVLESLQSRFLDRLASFYPYTLRQNPELHTVSTMLTSRSLASSIMCAQPAPTTNNSPLVNGHYSSPPTILPTRSVPESDSESALSDAVDDPAFTAPTSKLETYKDSAVSPEIESASDASQDEDAFGSDDPDFRAEPAIHHSADMYRDRRSTSQEYPQQRKRKLVTEDEEFMKNNPELYGLRRSVCNSSLPAFALAKRPL